MESDGFVVSGSMADGALDEDFVTKDVHVLRHEQRRRGRRGGRHWRVIDGSDGAHGGDSIKFAG